MATENLAVYESMVPIEISILKKKLIGTHKPKLKTLIEHSLNLQVFLGRRKSLGLLKGNKVKIMQQQCQGDTNFCLKSILFFFVT